MNTQSRVSLEKRRKSQTNHVFLRALEYGRQPYYIGAEVLEIVYARDDALEVAGA